MLFAAGIHNILEDVKSSWTKQWNYQPFVADVYEALSSQARTLLSHYMDSKLNPTVKALVFALRSGVACLAPLWPELVGNGT